MENSSDVYIQQIVHVEPHKVWFISENALCLPLSKYWCWLSPKDGVFDPLRLLMCCSGSPAAAVTRGHWHFQCSSDTICFLYFLAQRKRLRKQFNRERIHTHIYNANRGTWMFAIQAASDGIGPFSQSAYPGGPLQNTIVH